MTAWPFSPLIWRCVSPFPVLLCGAEIAELSLLCGTVCIGVDQLPAGSSPRSSVGVRA
jgi:hypothetical protein